MFRCPTIYGEKKRRKDASYAKKTLSLFFKPLYLSCCSSQGSVGFLYRVFSQGNNGVLSVSIPQNFKGFHAIFA